MSRNLLKAELGFGIDAENGSSLAYIISGTAIPDGVSGQQGNAPIGSLYLRSGTGELYQKIANAGAPADYQLNGSSSATIGKWRPETVSIVTNDTQGAGTRDVVVSPFADDNGSVLLPADFIVGEYIISDADGTPALLEITAVSGDDVTFALAGDPLVAEDTFVTKFYLPDPNGGENRAIVNYNGSLIVKLSDIDWQLATGINLSSGYVAINGSISASESIESAISKLDGNQQDIQSASGLAQGAVNYGAFTGALLSDNQTSKQNFQQLETEAEAVRTLTGTSLGATVLGAFASVGSIFLGASLNIKAALQKLADVLGGLRGVQVTGVTASAVIDSVPHASVKCAKWLVEVFTTATPANREAFELFAVTDGTNIDETKYAKLKLGSGIAGLSVTVVITGANMELKVAATNSATVNVRRIEIVKDVL